MPFLGLCGQCGSANEPRMAGDSGVVVTPMRVGRMQA